MNSEKIHNENLKFPEHLAIIMDGNGRWAKSRNKLRIFGHENGAKSVRDSIEYCVENKIPYLTLYAFSTENWKRPKLEVDTLMRLLVKHLKGEFEDLNKNNVRLNAIGDLTNLPPKVFNELTKVIEIGGKYVKNEYYEEGKEPEKSVDVEIIIKLKEENKAFKAEKYVHNYPHCWRTDKPILYYPLDSWFIKVTDVKDRMHELNKTVNWKPKATGEGRFGNWLQNANDWNLSRSRYWGIPLPIWRTEDGTEEIIIGSIQELKSEMKKSVEAGFMKEDIFADFEVGNMDDANYEKVDLHKNIVDKIVLVSSSGKPMHRESDLIDVWFDSGSMPYAQWHYTFGEYPCYCW